MKRDIRHLNINYRTMSVYSDRVITASQVSSLPSKKDKGKAERKEGVIRMIFVDSVTNSTVADVVMTSIGAEQLIRGINQSLAKLKEDLKNPTIPQPSVEKRDHTYIG